MHSDLIIKLVASLSREDTCVRTYIHMGIANTIQLHLPYSGFFIARHSGE